MRRIRKGRLAALGLAGAGVLAMAFAPMALAAAGDPNLSVRGIDGTDQQAVKVTFLWSGDPTKLSGLTLREDGTVMKVADLTELNKTDERLGTVFVVDLSGSMNHDGTLTAVRKGLTKYADTLPQGDEMAIVSYNDTAIVESTFTDDAGQLHDAINGMAAPTDGKTATYDGLKKATALVHDLDKLQPNIVLVSDGPDDVSDATANEAAASVVGSGAALFGVELGHAGGTDNGYIDGLASRTGGSTFVAADSAATTSTFDGLSTAVHDQYVATYASAASQGQVDVNLTIGGVTRKASFVAGAKVTGAGTTQVVSAPKAFGPGFLHTKSGGLIGLALVGAAAGLGAFAIASLAGSSDESLTAVLRPYSEGPAMGGEDEHDGALAQTALLQRAVEITEDFAERQGFLIKVESALERADLPLRPAEALFFWGAGAIILTLGFLALGGVVAGGFIGLITVLVPPAIVNFMAGRRGKQFQSSLPDTLSLLSGSLRAGYSLLQGVEAVSKEVQDPMGKELRRIITEARLGREIEDAMEQVAERMASPDFAWAVMAVRIQREVGGNLSELLLTVADTMVQRERLRRDVAALTAEGKISAIILGLLPIGLGAFMWIGNPEYMHPLGATTLGHVLLGLATLAGLIGFAWMKKIIAIKI